MSDSAQNIDASPWEAIVLETLGIAPNEHGITTASCLRCEEFDRPEAQPRDAAISLAKQRMQDCETQWVARAVAIKYRQYQHALLRSGPGASLAVAFWLPLAWCLAFVTVRSGGGEIHRLSRVLDDMKCPRCGYSTKECSNTAPPILLAHCPECGLAWPLVPPHAPGWFDVARIQELNRRPGALPQVAAQR